MSDAHIFPGAPSGLKQNDGIETGQERVGSQLDRMVSQLHGKLWEASSRGRLFNACSQAATTTTIALAATYTGLCLSNPAASGMNLEPLIVGTSLSIDPVAATTITLAGGYAAAGVVTHTTPLTVYNMKLDLASSAVGLADAAATLPGTPIDIMPLVSGLGPAQIEPSGCLFDVQGGVCIPPGGYVFIETLTVSIGFFGIWWAEYPE